MKNNLLPISSAGFQYIAYTALAFIVLTIFDFDFLAFLAFVLLVALAFVYRNPEREILAFEPNSVLSPVDGSVLSIEEIKDSKYAYKIEIESNYLDVGVLRVPLDATLESLNIQRGTRLPNSSLLHNKINENAELTFSDNNANSIKVKHQLSRSFDSLNIDITSSQSLRQSSRYGVMIDGITTIYLPHNFRVNVAIGNELKASQTLIGYFS